MRLPSADLTHHRLPVRGTGDLISGLSKLEFSTFTLSQFSTLQIMVHFIPVRQFGDDCLLRVRLPEIVDPKASFGIASIAGGFDVPINWTLLKTWLFRA